MKIAVQGCTHGDLDLIYELLDRIEKAEQIKINLLICCGDFQATRNQEDLLSMAVPKKYLAMKDFHDYYAGRKKAPILTVLIGGNHEAANHMWQLPYGGWVAENMYYLGYAGVIKFGNIRIAGMSGIYNSKDFNKGHFEHPPFNESDKRSFYHVKHIETARLRKLTGSHIDICLSHDWPSNIQLHGNIEEIYTQKPFLRNDPIEDHLAGNDPAEELLHLLQPTYWFAAHHHCKFSAIVKHSEERHTKFLALGKCLPGKDFLQVMDIDAVCDNDLVLKYDLHWLSILKTTDHFVKISCHADKYDAFKNIEKDKSKFYSDKNAKKYFDMYLQKFGDDLDVIPLDAHEIERSRIQTIKFCEKFDLTDPCLCYDDNEDIENDSSDDSIGFSNTSKSVK